MSTSVQPAVLAELRALEAAATQGPWETKADLEHFFIDAGQDSDDCPGCRRNMPLQSSEDYPVEGNIGAHTRHAHLDGVHHVVSATEPITGSYDVDLGGILKDDDTKFIAGARNIVPRLLDAVEAALSLADAWEDRAAHDLAFAVNIPQGLREGILDAAAENQDRARKVRHAINNALETP